ncbi:3-isopropylmalate dehydratase large subunit [bacterium]|nr:3-isopropylmalate dehydratase large subunit [bacterium]
MYVPMSITHKILAGHCGKGSVRPGEFIKARVDCCLGNDITAPLSINEFERARAKKVFDPERVYLVPDHSTPNKDIKSAQLVKQVRDFAIRHGLKYYFEVGQVGIEHALLPEQGLVLPGELIIGADSHTCTYGALGAFATGIGSTDLAAAMITGEVWLKVPECIKFIYKGKPAAWVTGKDLILYTIGRIGVDGALYMGMEFTGNVIDDLPMDDRFTMCNMAIEAGAKNGIITPDQKAVDYCKERAVRPFECVSGDTDASYREVFEWNVDGIEPQVAFPHLPSNVKPISEVGTVRIDQSVIGSCTNGRMSDLRAAAKVLKGEKVHPRVRLIIIPATQRIYREAMDEGLLAAFLDAGAVISPPTCGPCLGGHMGVLAEGERAIATTNRNFVGRMGHPKSEVYLSNPAVAAASAILGRIGGPGEIKGRG